jgi:hypothetical protein
MESADKMVATGRHAPAVAITPVPSDLKEVSSVTFGFFTEQHSDDFPAGTIALNVEMRCARGFIR